jgi:DNA-binding CsgD family transcriptional regulator
MGNSSVKRTLTRTEIEVFIDCVKGLTLAQSGIKRSAPRPTQSSRLARGIEKLSAKNTAHAALKAIALGYDLEVRRNPGETTIGLPQRRRQVLCLLAQGLEYADIAGVLAISEGTAGVHGQRLYHAIGARKRAAVVRRAIELGLFVWPLPVAD